jgi:glycosyltransferase involved in cell wall biosynthesis
VITRFVRGGADENTLISCNGQVANGHSVHLIIGAEHSAAMLARLDPCVRVHIVPPLVRDIRPRKDITALIAMTALLRRLQPDIVHTHTSKAGIIGRLAATLSGADGVVHGVHILPFVNTNPVAAAFYIALEKICAMRTHAFVNVSQSMADIGLAHGIGAPQQHRVIASGMNIAEYRNAAPFSHAELASRLGGGVAASRALLVCAAALEPRKRQFEFLDVFANVHAAMPSTHLALLGEGADEPRLRARVAALGLADAVTFAGFSNEVSRWIASASVCVFASEREGLPRTVVQYAMGGAPIVATRLPGIERVVIDRESGFLVDVDRLADMTGPIVRLITSPALAAHARDAAATIDFSPWDADRMIDDLEALYDQVLRPMVGRMAATAHV